MQISEHIEELFAASSALADRIGVLRRRWSDTEMMGKELRGVRFAVAELNEAYSALSAELKVRGDAAAERLRRDFDGEEWKST